MKPTDLMERLLGRGKLKQLGHFYVFNGLPKDSESQVEWVKTFIRRYWQEVEQRKIIPADIISDADLLWQRPPVNDDDEPTDYKVEALEQALAGFLPYKGLQSQRRFVVFEESHRLSTVISNKLLKTLEEPEGELTFIWLNPLGKKFLPTITSRAISLPLTWPTVSVPLGEQLTRVKERLMTDEYPLAAFLEDAKKGTVLGSELLEEMLNYEQHFDSDGHYQQELLILLKSWQEAERFNQPMATRLQGLHQLLTQRFRASC